MSPLILRLRRGPRLPPLASLIVTLGGGIVIGIFMHYFFYRLSLPVEPFIYVSF